MRVTICAIAFALTCIGAPSQADPKTDADYIVSQTVTRTLFEGALAAQRPLIIGAIQNDLRSKGVTLPDPDRFFDLFIDEFIDEFTQEMQAQTASVYLATFSGQQLADIADFYKTEAGQALIEVTPALMIEGARMGQIAGEKAGANAGRRLAARIESEGLVVVDDPSLLGPLLDALK